MAENWNAFDRCAEHRITCPIHGEQPFVIAQTLGGPVYDPGRVICRVCFYAEKERQA